MGENRIICVSIATSNWWLNSHTYTHHCCLYYLFLSTTKHSTKNVHPHFASAFGMSGITGACSALRVGRIVEHFDGLMGIQVILML
jgi:hypothetical protein